MRKSYISFILVLCFLLSICSGCSGTTGKQIAQQTTTQPSEAAAITSTEEAESIQETLSPEAVPEESVIETPSPDAPDDPEALGQWLWDLQQAAATETFAVDEDITMTFHVLSDADDLTISTSSRVKQIQHEDGSLTYQCESRFENTVTTTWYDDGVMYLSDEYGNYKAPYDEASFANTYLNDMIVDTASLGKDAFGTLTGEKTETGYLLSYGEVSLDAWAIYSDFISSTFSSLGLEGSCQDLKATGTMTLAPSGNLLRHDFEVTITVDVLGTQITEEIQASQVINNRNENVSISVPTDDESYVEMSDISIPTIFSDGYNTTLAQDALTYQDTMALTVSDGDTSHVFLQQDDISYMYDSSYILSAVWDSSLSQDGERLSWFSDSYSNGEGVYSDDTGDAPYTYDDASFAEDIFYFVTLYTDSFSYGTNFVSENDGDRTKLTYDLDPAYVEMLLSEYSETYGAGIYFEDASSISSDGTMTVWFDSFGLMVEQTIQCTSELTMETGVFTVTLEDTGTVSAFGSDVVLPSSY